jgi:hypothetical protein
MEQEYTFFSLSKMLNANFMEDMMSYWAKKEPGLLFNDVDQLTFSPKKAIVGKQELLSSPETSCNKIEEKIGR